MSNFFSLESPFYKFMSRLTDMLKLNTLWLFTSGVAEMFIIQLVLAFSGLGEYQLISYIPLVMTGAATTAAFHITLKMVDEQEGYIAKAYFQAYRENFKKGTVIGIVFLFAVYAIWLDFQFFNAAEQLNQSSMGYLTVGILASVLAFMHLIYAFPLQARYENTVINTLRNSFSITIRYFIRTIFLFIISAFLVAFFIWNNVTIFLGILIGPATLMLAISGFAIQAFRLIECANQETEEQGHSEEE